MSIKLNKKSYQQLLVLEIVPRIFNFTVVKWMDTMTSEGRLSLENLALFLDQVCLHVGICVELYNMLNCSRILTDSYI